MSTQIDPRYRQYVAPATRAVRVVDMRGPALSALYDLLKRTRGSSSAWSTRASARETFDRRAAIHHTLRYDDGCHSDGLLRSDVVVVGISRSGKNFTCFYVAYQGVTATNAPLVSSLPLELVAVPAECVIGLVVNACRLLARRDARTRHLGVAGNGVHQPRRAEARSPRSSPRDEPPQLADDQRVVHGDRGDRARFCRCPACRSKAWAERPGGSNPARPRRCYSVSSSLINCKASSASIASPGPGAPGSNGNGGRVVTGAKPYFSRQKL